jgi:hypothetical protein
MKLEKTGSSAYSNPDGCMLRTYRNIEKKCNAGSGNIFVCTGMKNAQMPLTRAFPACYKVPYRTSLLEANDSDITKGEAT